MHVLKILKGIRYWKYIVLFRKEMDLYDLKAIVAVGEIFFWD